LLEEGDVSDPEERFRSTGEDGRPKYSHEFEEYTDDGA
jgi:hypothetical protein